MRLRRHDGVECTSLGWSRGVLCRLSGDGGSGCELARGLEALLPPRAQLHVKLPNRLVGMLASPGLVVPGSRYRVPEKFCRPPIIALRTILSPR